ncbi:MAG: sugar kinase [Microbacterium sp.]
MTVDVVTAGEIMVAVRCDGLLRLGQRAQLSIAGAEGNVAIGLARLGHDVAWAGRVGDDEAGALVRRTLRAEGVGLEAVVVDDERETGLLTSEQRMSDRMRVEYHRRGSAGSRWSESDVARALALHPRIVHVTGITPAVSDEARAATVLLIRSAAEAGVRVSIDVNYRSRLWSREEAARVMAPLVRSASIVIASPDELELVATDPAELLAAGVDEVVLKDGARGARAHTADGETASSAKAVRAVDAVGAGDAFSAGYLSGVLDGGSVSERLERATRLGAFAVTSRGDWEGLPTRGELAMLDDADGAVAR